MWCTIKGYLCYRLFALTVWLSAIIMTACTSLLAGLEIAYALYGAALAFFLLVIICCFDCFRYMDRVRMLENARKNISDTLHMLPEADNPLTAEYQAVIESLFRQMRRQREELISAGADQIEYYTMWLHQIKTPISAIRLALDMRESSVSSLLNTELFKIERYVEMALQYARMGSIACDLIIKPCRVDDIVISAVKKYASVFIQKKLYVDIKKTNLTVYSDEKWLAFVIEQLISNAVKYTQNGGVKIYGEGNELIFEDTGIGIRSDDIDMIFERGYTGYNGRNDRRASGLGLYMSKKIADVLNVNIFAVSGCEKGANLHMGFENVIKKD